jgi:recombination protein RecT
MNAIESLKGALEKPKVRPLQDLIQQSVKELGRALPAHLGPDRLVRIALTCIRLNPALANCSPESFLGSLFTLAQLGLEPIAGRAYLLPFNNRRKVGNEWKSVLEVQALVGYKGLVELFYRHEKAVMLTWGVVHEADEFDYQKGTDQFLKHKPANKNRGAVVGYWVSAQLQNGGKPFEYMSAEACLAHGAKHSKTYDKNNNKFYESSPWFKDPEAMCLKTVLIQLAKLLPLSMELQQAIANDETSRDFRRGVSDVLDIPQTTDWSEPAEIAEAETVPASVPAPTAEVPNTQTSSEVPGNREERYISAKQRGLVHGKFKSKGKDESVLREYLVAQFGRESTSAIPASKMDSVLKWIDSL